MRWYRRKIPSFKAFKYYFFLYLEIWIGFAQKISSKIFVVLSLLKLRVGKSKILLGPNFTKHKGGVWSHMQGILKQSIAKPILFPSNNLVGRYGYNNQLKKFDAIFKNEIFYKNVNVFHTHVYVWGIELAAYLRNKTNFKWVHTYHLHYYPEHNNGELLAWQQEINRTLIETASKADVRLVVSKWQQAYYLREHNIKTTYLPNGVDVVPCDNANGERFIQKLGISDFILNVGRHDPVKNPREFVALALSMPNEHFVIIGGGLTNEILLEEYHVEIPINLTLWGGAPKEEVLDAIKACKVLVSTSKMEGLPTLVLEAMTLERPVVVSNEPGSMEAIDQGKYGYFYELSNLQNLKAKVELAINDKEKPKMARKRVLEHYDWRVIAPKLDAIYKGEQLEEDA